VPLRIDMRVLDVGCGRGQLLSVLHRAGFRHLLGVDPYLTEPVEVVPGLQVLKCAVSDVKQQFDFIMLHHVFEHIEDGFDLLNVCRNRLAPDGTIMLRIPTVASMAWEHYGEYWVQLDAPRHLMLHTPRSLEYLAQRAGLQVTQTWCDSSMHQFIGSELYLKGLPLIDTCGRPTLPEAHFTPDQLRRFAREAETLNAAGRGDQMVALLRADPSR
jgi:SAM-dependent methyltransferase